MHAKKALVIRSLLRENKSKKQVTRHPAHLEGTYKDNFILWFQPLRGECKFAADLDYSKDNGNDDVFAACATFSSLECNFSSSLSSSSSSSDSAS